MAPFECRHAGDWGYENGAQYMYAEYDRVCGMEMPGALWAEQYAPYGDGCQELVEKLQAVLTENNELKTEKGLLEQRLYGASQQLERLKRRLAHWQDVCRKMAKEPAAPEGVPLRKLSGSSETSTAAGSVSSGTIPSKDDHASPQMRPQPPPVSQRVPAAEMIPVLPQQLSPGHALPEALWVLAPSTAAQTNGLNEETVPGIAIPGRAPARVRTDAGPHRSAFVLVRIYVAFESLKLCWVVFCGLYPGV
ncbi:unnamed protein product [Symbiodinium natans]|uniref:Uncharacterized protein n=1 Tax=Symbiodinium natans TaxID=878477 RepID=A0A812JS39_9DINO|nr:unnamed protein product [Symbiodinium natans]